MPHVIDLERQFEKWWTKYGHLFPYLLKFEAKKNFIENRMAWEQNRKDTKYVLR